MGKVHFNKADIRGKMSKKKLALIIFAAAAIAAAIIYVNMFRGSDPVEFEKVSEGDLPKEITSDIIPKYRDLERALACSVNDDIYVIVTRGEKPTSGYKVAVNSLSMQKQDEKEVLIVYADFKDPDKKTAFSQIITYPVQVVKTDLKRLPDEIELRIQY